MLFQPAIIALLLAGAVSLLVLVAASPFAVQVIRRWDMRSGSELQLVLERRTYLFSTLTAFVFVTQIGALLLTVFNADKMAVMFVGAMCAVGTLNANAWGFPMLHAQIAVFFLAAVWLTLNQVDNQAPDYPLVRVKYALLLLLLPALAATFALQLKYFLNLRADVITSCCGSLFSEQGPALASEESGMEAKTATTLSYAALRDALLAHALHHRSPSSPTGCMPDCASAGAASLPPWPAPPPSSPPSSASSPSSRSTCTSTRITTARSACSSRSTAIRAICFMCHFSCRPQPASAPESCNPSPASAA